MTLKKILTLIVFILAVVVGYKYITKFNCIPAFNSKDNQKINRELYWAALKGDYKNVCTLIHNGANVNYLFTDNNNQTPLYYAASHGYDSNLNPAGKVELPRMDIMETRLKIVKLLIKRGANVNTPTALGLTPLHHAATKEIAETLIKNGAIVDAQTKSDAWEGITPLFQATGRHKSVAEVLIKHGANVNQTTIKGDTPLMSAVRNNNLGVVELLLKHGAEINWKDDNSMTALEFALQSKRTQIAQLLIDQGANQSSQSELGLHALHWAVLQKNITMVEKILEKGGDVDPVSKDGRTPLMEAVMNNNKDVAELLLNHGANVNFSSKLNWYNRPIVFFAKDKEMLALLLSHGANTNAIDSNGKDIFYSLQSKPDLIEMVKNSANQVR